MPVQRSAPADDDVSEDDDFKEYTAPSIYVLIANISQAKVASYS